ncbi:hypothetical protein G3I24_42310, partial [Micromonospora aurantiaca]|nr:hypothetical protein [Micromonospora aurantiaca]
MRLAVTADIDPAGLPLTEIRSALHVVSQEGEGGCTTMRLQPGERLDRDFILRLGFAPHEAAALILVPDEKATRYPPVGPDGRRLSVVPHWRQE